MASGTKRRALASSGTYSLHLPPTRRHPRPALGCRSSCRRWCGRHARVPQRLYERVYGILAIVQIRTFQSASQAGQHPGKSDGITRFFRISWARLYALGCPTTWPLDFSDELLDVDAAVVEYGGGVSGKPA